MKLEGSFLPLWIKEHCFAKKEILTFFEVSRRIIVVENTGNERYLFGVQEYV